MRLSDQLVPTLVGPIRRTPLVSAVMTRISQLIYSGAYTPGEKLPSERELRDELEVGRSTVREALRGLEALGLIQLRQGRGAFVCPLDPAIVDSNAEQTGVDAQVRNLKRVIEARLAIECQTAALAATRRSDRELALIEAQIVTFEEALNADDLPGLVLADVVFHEAIAEAANPVLAAALRSVVVLGIQARHRSLAKRQRRGKVLTRHRAIVRAIAKRDAQAARVAMEQHLNDPLLEAGRPSNYAGGRHARKRPAA